LLSKYVETINSSHFRLLRKEIPICDAGHPKTDLTVTYDFSNFAKIAVCDDQLESGFGFVGARANLQAFFHVLVCVAGQEFLQVAQRRI